MSKVLVSDLHADPAFEVIVDHIISKHPGKDVLDLGDNANSATEAEFMCIYNQLVRLSKTNRVIAIEGNHDNALMGNFLKKESLKCWNNTIGKFKPKNKITAGLCYEWISKDNVVVAVNSTDPTDKVISARGYISRRLARELAKILDSVSGALRTVILHHHPFDNAFLTALKGTDRFMDAVNGRCEELFFGHKHRFYLDTSRKDYDIDVIYSANKTTEKVLGNCWMITVVDDDDRDNIKIWPEFVQ